MAVPCPCPSPAARRHERPPACGQPWRSAVLVALVTRAAPTGALKFHSSTAQVEASLPLLPYPASVQALQGTPPFSLSGPVEVLLGPGASAADPAVASLQRQVGRAARAVGEAASSYIRLAIAEDARENPESYRLVVNGSSAEITAASPAGLAYGARTLEQLVLAASSGGPSAMAHAIQAVDIFDAPVFKWRGMHLDVSRHFFPIADVKRLLDTMAMFKLNRFHWHLTDDQGWRIPIPGYPLLTTKGSGPRMKDGQVVTGEGVEGSYSEADIEAVVAYAAALHIEVVPEIDVPGHAAAAISAYPELGNVGSQPPPAPLNEWGQFKWTLSPTQETVKFLEAVVDTVARLFPSAYYHVGGDEAPTSQWSATTPEGRSRWLPGTRPWQVQSFFNERLADILSSRGKRFMGWDETQKFMGLPRNATVIAWRGDNEMKKAIANGIQVIQANLGFLYFDFIQGPKGEEPKGQLPVVPLETTFQRCRSFAQDMEHQPLVLGAQGQLWTEYITTREHLEYMAFPRALALAECVWTPPQGAGGFADFLARLRPQLRHLEEIGVNFHRL
mmetsp:Transcript_101208/g.263915  ORF Transcript_101208/g.263915 Transcript_101208/m.263915 type:complete len:559 (-) Transcript_101208:131-1807(-)